MKKFLKKANRGLLLSAICLSILTIYVTADYISFQSQKDTINQTINNYYSAIYDSNTSQLKGSKEHSEEIKKIINDYWCDSETSLDWATNQSEMMDNVSQIFDGKDVVYDISKVDFNIKQIKIKKSGPGYASVELSYSASITGKSGSYTLTPSSYRILSEDMYEDEYMYDDEYSEEDENQEDDKEDTPKEGTLSYQADATIELHKENGEWKICAIQAYDTYSSFNYSDAN